MKPQQTITDRLTDVVRHLQRVHVTLKQSQADVDVALACTLEIARVIKEVRPATAQSTSTQHLDLAALRAGLSFASLSYLASIPEPRLRSIAAGDPPTQTERVAITDVLPTWTPEGGAQ
jgi:hypothetical protein